MPTFELVVTSGRNKGFMPPRDKMKLNEHEKH